MTEVVPVDFRDIDWELWDPVYRVRYWSKAHEALSSRDYEIRGSDVDAVLEWAKTHAEPHEHFIVSAIVDQSGVKGAIRLAGRDPTRTVRPSSDRNALPPDGVPVYCRSASNASAMSTINPSMSTIAAGSMLNPRCRSSQ